MIVRLVLLVTLAVSFSEGAGANYIRSQDIDGKVLQAIQEDEAARDVEQKETKEEIEQMISEKGLIRSVFGRAWELIKDVVTAPFKFLKRVLNFIILVPRLVIESFNQTTRKVIIKYWA